MTGMNRLSPLIVRRAEPCFPGSGATMLDMVKKSASATLPASARGRSAGDRESWLDDLRLVATGWIGGLIFFGTLIG
ncbi:hypothetical protein [Sphingosinicella sp. CPCC 101087]|uniref:hypothetical protein n=1 Tax=Sphingosinicella sp. CPCC 101087 TaxID=2497754 RepID=UPI00101C19D5|nr:hypothetical protein [Sphingosinicella sp. CPCC 101087]